MILRVEFDICGSRDVFRCTRKHCGRMAQPSAKKRLSEAQGFLLTSRQIYYEASIILHEANTWSLQAVIFARDMVPEPRTKSVPSLFDTLCGNIRPRLSDEICGSVRGIYIKRFSMWIFLSPLGTCLLSIPTHIDQADDATFDEWYEQQDHVAARSEVIDEEAQCEAYRKSLQSLTDAQANAFPSLRLLTLKISIHWAKHRLSVRNPPLPCVKFEVRIKFGGQNASSRGLGQISTTLTARDLRYQKREKARLVNETSKAGNKTDQTALGPRRFMLAQLAELQGVQGIEVERHWRVRYFPPIGDDTKIEALHAMRQYLAFDNVQELLDGVGPQFCTLYTTGLTEFGIDPSDVIEIENTDPLHDSSLLLNIPAAVNSPFPQRLMLR